MQNKLKKIIKALSLSIIIGIGSTINAYASFPLVNSFDTLDNLVSGSNTTITTNNTTYFEGSGSVMMSWDASINDRGYFDWILPVDPDFTGTTISFNVYPPSFITEISLELIDSSDQVAEGWNWNVQPSWYNRYNTITVTQGNQSGATSYSVGPGNITEVMAIRFDERSGNGGWSYNYWDVTTTVPEPNTFLITGVGLVLLTVARKKMLV